MSARHTMTSFPVGLDKNPLPAAHVRFILAVSMATLLDFLTHCVLPPAGSKANGLCKLCALKSSGLITEDHDFQLWIEERLDTALLGALVKNVCASPAPTCQSEAFDLLAAPLRPAKLSGPPVTAPHRPAVVARAVDGKPMRDLVDRLLSVAGRPAADRNFSPVFRQSTSVSEADIKAAFDHTIRLGSATVWVGWRDDLAAEDLVSHLKGSVNTLKDANQWFALGWDIEEMGKHDPAYLFIFTLPDQADARVPTIADAMDPANVPKDWKARWHPYFLPTPAHLPTGAIRDLSIKPPAKQWLVNAFARREAIFTPFGGADPVVIDHLLPLQAA